ncbi:hypothetical protein BJX61DRAFT_539535 [Aspergillus egyptiacus]|nr:hypothetical protein BJX61DRAFT_539535 [Aspergillus egyptiacus]
MSSISSTSFFASRPGKKHSPFAFLVAVCIALGGFFGGLYLLFSEPHKLKAKYSGTVKFKWHGATARMNPEMAARFLDLKDSRLYCLPGAVNNRIVRLRRKAEGDTAGENSNSSGNRNANAAESGTGTGAGSAETSPQKRKVERKPRGKGDAKAKAVVTADEAGSPKKRRVRQVKDIDGDGGEGGEGVGLVKREVKDEVMGQEDEDEEMA